MNELELLKKDWKKREGQYPQLSYDEIYRMILKRSSSIVKWIFIISLLEFVCWTLLSIVLSGTEAMKRFESYEVDWIVIPLSMVGYVILFYFFYRFYRNYCTISVTDNAKKLMENILRTRKTVRHYVYFNLIFFVVSTILVIFIQHNYDPEFIRSLDTMIEQKGTFITYALLVGVLFAAIVFSVGVFLLFYWLIYGLLLRKLNRNYKELKKMEV